METTHRRTVSQLLQAWGQGDLQAREVLIPLVYQELRKRAVAYLRRERRDHTLQPTALVNEAYIRLMGQQRVTWLNRAQFFGVAAQAMRRILVDYAREREAAKRPRGIRLTLDEGMRTVAAGGLRAAHAGRRTAGAGADRRAAGTDRGVEVLRRALGGRSGSGAVAVTRDGHARVAVGARLAVSPHDQGPWRGVMTDDRNRWPRVKEIFHSALAQGPDQRAAFVRHACGDDPALEREVDSLLAAHAARRSVCRGSRD